MKSLTALCLAFVVLFAFTGCRSKAEKQKEQQDKQAAAETEMKAKIPPDSPMAKVNFGMSEGEVGAILGPPTSQDNHTTGKQWIPFNFSGRDTFRQVYYYKGMGRVEFSSGSWGQRNGVVVIDYDPDEPGFYRKKK